MPSSCAVSGSVTKPWQPTATPAAPLAHASSPSYIRPQAPGYLTSHTAQHPCERLSVAPQPQQLGRRRGDGGDGCQRDGVQCRWENLHRSWPKRANCGNESAMVRPANQRPADKLPTFYFAFFFLLANAPFILEAYIYFLGVQCLVSLSASRGLPSLQHPCGHLLPYHPLGLHF
jgi:hypothetical protein